MKKNILLVHNFYQIGGGEHTVFQNEKDMLIKNGHTVTEYTKTNNSLKSNSLKLLLMPFTTLFSLSTYFAVKKLIKQNNIDVVHCHNTFPLISPSVYYAAWACKVPVVQTMHNFRFACANGLFYRDGKICEDCICGKGKPVRHGCYRSSKIQTMPVVLMQKIHSALGTYKRLNYIFLTQFNKDKLLPVLKPQGKVFVKTNFVKNIPIIPDIKVNLNKFIFVGRLDEYKGIDFLLDFFLSHKEYELCIYGSGALEEAVKAAAKQSANIKFMGFKSHERMQQNWQSSCGFIFSGKLYETMGLTVAESMVQGVPVICTDVGNPGAMVADGYTGMHFNLYDNESLIKAIKNVQENREEYSQNALAQAQKYSEAENYLMLKNIYNEL